MLLIILGIIISYVIGSLPTAYLYGKVFKGIDIRKHGSGNIGATNALRIFGKKAGILVLLIDVIKGVVPVIFIGNYLVSEKTFFSPDLLRIILGLGCISGHNWTMFLGFKGGKGVATTLGVLIALSFKIPGFAQTLGILILVWLAVFLFFRIISLASVAGALIFPVLVFSFNHTTPVTYSCVIFSVFIILRHLPNLKRLLQGKEPRLNFKKTK